MIQHSYTNASDNLGQYMADKECACPRQEVTIGWYLDNMIDFPFWRYVGDDAVEWGDDPWRYHMDLPIDAEEAIARGWRIFVQRNQMRKENEA